MDIPSLLQIQTFKTKDTLQIYPHTEHNHLEGVKSFVAMRRASVRFTKTK
ncbi:hypothetical protein ACT7DA_16530 [Bacillus pacificus]